MSSVPSNSESSLSPNEQRLQRLYGKLPSRAALLNKKINDRKYFDSGDYAMNKAASSNDQSVSSYSNYTTNSPNHDCFVGQKHPNPCSIPKKYLSDRQNSSNVTSTSPRSFSMITTSDI